MAGLLNASLFPLQNVASQIELLKLKHLSDLNLAVQFNSCFMNNFSLALSLKYLRYKYRFMIINVIIVTVLVHYSIMKFEDYQPDMFVKQALPAKEQELSYGQLWPTLVSQTYCIDIHFKYVHLCHNCYF